VSEASNQLEIKSQEILINGYVNKVVALKADLADVAPELEVQNNPQPTSVQPELSAFLAANDCSTAADKDACYVRTKLVLIKMSRRIDYLASRLYVAKGTVNNLVTNINEVISGLDSVKLQTKKK
jgi:hypothetical protein